MQNLQTPLLEVPMLMRSFLTSRLLHPAKRPLISTSLSVLLSLTGSWLIASTIVSPSAQAYTADVSFALDVQPDESYDTLLRRAEAVARAAAQRSFDRDILVTDVAVAVSAQNRATIVPVLSLNVSRSQWQSRPDPQVWATYYRTAQALLKINPVPLATAASAPTVAPSTQPRRSRPVAPRPTTKPASSRTTATPSVSRPRRGILPERIPTPARIGK
ncbi:hypothetical protein H6F43_05245 [Leptolyngbya sp. FACHB-36]|uniref:hypothetical protein n=1 Tax=Leptolyngbya sp. FACHB-36 TaxID=2692808 RepID=UPI00168072FD|nr:hypothetical protein [Leptolyngbya sp. FACHB-36]MBD2019590.1 hypothetical protein [Leptolyngbya sp. FACHB-36]